MASFELVGMALRQNLMSHRRHATLLAYYKPALTTLKLIIAMACQKINAKPAVPPIANACTTLATFLVIAFIIVFAQILGLRLQEALHA